MGHFIRYFESYLKMKGINILFAGMVLAVMGTGVISMTRNERNVLRSQGKNWGDGSHEFDQDMFDVDEAECGKYKENMRCFCIAYFSLGAMLPPYRPKFLCESCRKCSKPIVKHFCNLWRHLHS